MRSSGRASLALLLAVHLAIASPACSSDGGEPPAAGGPRGDATTDVGPGIAGEALPLEPVLVQSEDDVALLRGAVNVLAERCMRAQGFEFTPYPLDRYASPVDVSIRYGALLLEQAQEFGYMNPDAEALQAWNADVAAVDAAIPDDPAYLEALFGSVVPTPEGGYETDEPGCVAQAETTIYGAPGGFAGLPIYDQVVRLQVESSEEMYATEEARDAIARWSDCMLEAGYRFQQWWDARQQYPNALDDSTPPSADQQRQAVADAECRAATGLERILYEIESEILSQKMDDSAESLRQFEATVATAAERAADVVTSG